MCVCGGVLTLQGSFPRSALLGSETLSNMCVAHAPPNLTATVLMAFWLRIHPVPNGQALGLSTFTRACHGTPGFQGS